MQLKKLFKKIPTLKIWGSREVNITGVSSSSKVVSPGNLFIAKKGLSSDGHKYIPEAIAAGCVACVTDLYNPTLSIPQVVVEDVNSLEGVIAATYYQHPSDTLYSVGITGTNGKTTTSFMIKHLLDQFMGPSGLMGTIEYIIGRCRYTTTHTTADVSTNHKLLREMVLQGCKSSVMEVTSHAIDQGRICEIDYDVAIFTNLTQDHLDYHKTMEAYGAVKNRLFRTLTPAHKSKSFKRYALLNGESPWAEKMGEGCLVPRLTYGIEGNYTLNASQVELTSKGSKFKVVYEDQQAVCHIPLVGRFNVLNALAALGTVVPQGVSLSEACDKLKSFKGVRGRLENVPNNLGLTILVDYAHTDDALRCVLTSLRELKKGRIITVFGCGGDRDQTKRPLMAKAVEELSDFAIVTVDNARSEDPLQICRDIMAGFQCLEKFTVELDRYLAIEKAIQMAKPGDIVLIAGKGHETKQIFADRILEFDDHRIAAEICQR